MHINEYGAMQNIPDQIWEAENTFNRVVAKYLDEIEDMVQVRALADALMTSGGASEYILRRAVQIRKEKRNG